MSKQIPSNNSLRVALVALTIGFVGCGSQAANTSLTQTITEVNDNLPQVVATTSILCDLARQVAEKTIKLTCLIAPGQDPHVYKPKPEDRQAIAQANLILYNGYNLEPGLIKLIKSSKNTAPKIAVGQVAVSQPQKFQKNGKRVTDPHIWHNTKNTIKMVEVISNSLGKLEPSNAPIYNNKAEQIKSELTQLDSWIKSTIATIPVKQRKLVTNHDGLGYYAKAYGLSLVGTLKGVSTQGKPSATLVNNLVKGVQQAKVPTIFAEKTINPNLIETVAREATVRVSERELYTDGLGEAGSEADTYQKMMVANTRTIVEGLGGTYLIFEALASQ